MVCYDIRPKMGDSISLARLTKQITTMNKACLICILAVSVVFCLPLSGDEREGRAETWLSAWGEFNPSELRSLVAKPAGPRNPSEFHRLQEKGREFIGRVEAVRVMPFSGLAPDPDRPTKFLVVFGEQLAILARRDHLIGHSEDEGDGHLARRERLQSGGAQGLRMGRRL